MARKSAFRDRVTKVISSAGLGIVRSEPVERDKVYCWQQIVWQINKVLADGDSRVRLYLEGHGYKHYLEGWKPVDADTLYSYNEDVWLVPGESIALELSNNQATTTVGINMTGYWTDRSEGIA